MFKSFLLLFLLVFCFLMRKFIKIAKNKINNSYLRYMQTLPQVPHFPHDQITIPFWWFCIHTFLIPHSSFLIPYSNHALGWLVRYFYCHSYHPFACWIAFSCCLAASARVLARQLLCSCAVVVAKSCKSHQLEGK